jgi:hypothetical protein
MSQQQQQHYAPLLGSMLSRTRIFRALPSLPFYYYAQEDTYDACPSSKLIGLRHTLRTRLNPLCQRLLDGKQQRTATSYAVFRARLTLTHDLLGALVCLLKPLTHLEERSWVFTGQPQHGMELDDAWWRLFFARWTEYAQLLALVLDEAKAEEGGGCAGLVHIARIDGEAFWTILWRWLLLPYHAPQKVNVSHDAPLYEGLVPRVLEEARPWRHGLAALMLQSELARCARLGLTLHVPDDAPIRRWMSALLLFG